MGPKINFYKKLEIPTLQKAYNKLFSFLKENERLGERGEYSVLNTTGANFLGKSQSRLFMNRSIISNRTLGMESMNEGNNILDELNDEKRKLDPKQSLMEATTRFHKEILSTNFKQLNPGVIESFLKKLDEVGEHVHGQIFRLTEQQNQNVSDEHILESVV